MTSPVCCVCGVELSEDNWNLSGRKHYDYRCKKCRSEYGRLWHKANPEYAREWYLHHRSLTIARAKKWQSENPDKANENNMRSRRKHGVLAMSDNKSCALYLGVHIAERVLSHVFKDVKRMPLHNPGYDFICNEGKLIDVKASVQQRNTPTASWRWKFEINHNVIADYFLCLAFDNREDLNPLHLWLLPSSKFNKMKAISISQSTLFKWSRYEQPIEKVLDCRDELMYFETGVV